MSRSASEPLLLSLVNTKIHAVSVSTCVKPKRSVEGDLRRREHGGTEKGGASGKLCRELGRSAARKRPQKSDEAILASMRGNARGAKGLYLQNETIRIESREESDGRKTHQRGQPALWRRVGNRSTAARNIRWNQCETRPKGIGERDQ